MGNRHPIRRVVGAFASLAIALGATLAVTGSPARASEMNPAEDVYAFGDAGFHGSTGGLHLARAIVGMAATTTGAGYYEVATDGGIFSYGDAHFYGSTGAIRLNKPIVGMAATPSGHGYWLVATDGGIFSFGDARFYGSTGAIRLNQPIVGMAATPSGHGYWLVASDGGMFSFGDARFFGSTGGLRLNRPIVGMARTPTGRGYWLVATDGGIFSFGDASFHGSTGAIRLTQPIVGMASTLSGRGYWLAARDGGVFGFGDAGFYGSMGQINLGSKSVIGIDRSHTGHGYWMVATRPVPPPPPAPPPVGPPPGFGSGTFRVGHDIAAGTYHNSDSSGDCYWERLRGFSGSLSDIIANNLTTSRQIVTIAATDAGFHSENCGTWTLDNHPLTASPTAPFSDGEYRVHRDLSPGLWRNNNSSADCYWERLRGFSGTLDDIIQNNLSTLIQTVQIASGDLGFQSQDCGTWTKIG